MTRDPNGGAIKVISGGFYGMWPHEFVRVAAVALAREHSAFSDVLMELANRMEAELLAAGYHVTDSRSSMCRGVLPRHEREPERDVSRHGDKSDLTFGGICYSWREIKHRPIELIREALAKDSRAHAVAIYERWQEIADEYAANPSTALHRAKIQEEAEKLLAVKSEPGEPSEPPMPHPEVIHPPTNLKRED